MSICFFEPSVLDLHSKKIKKGKTMSDYLDYMDEIYDELVEEFGHEIESNCIHKWYKSHRHNGVSNWLLQVNMK